MRLRVSLSFCAALLIACAPDPVTVGFIYNGPVEDYGWTKTHDEGRIYLETVGRNVTTLYTVGVDTTEAAAALDDLVAQGASIVFTTSFEFHPFARDAALRHGHLTTLNCSGFVQGERFGSYQARVEEMEYLSGMVAGAMTRSNKVGVVGGVRIYEQFVHINAFALGVKTTNPDADVIVRWIGWWLDPDRSFAAAQGLIDEEGVDVVKQFSNSNAPLRAADARGVWSIGHNNRDICNVAPATCLVAAYYNWGPYYLKIVDEIRSGAYPSSTGRIDYVSTADLNIAGLSDFADAVPDAVRAEVAQKKEQIRTRSFNVFQGPIRWADGTTTPAGEVVTDAELLCMGKWIDGVRDSPGPSCTSGTAECGDFMTCLEGRCVAPDLSGCE